MLYKYLNNNKEVECSVALDIFCFTSEFVPQQYFFNQYLFQMFYSSA